MNAATALFIGLYLCLSVTHASDQTTSGSQMLEPCADLPTELLSEEDLNRLVPNGSPGRVRVAWSTESQENTYGFNIMRSGSSDGPYSEINETVIPGEGTSSIPMNYCFEDAQVLRGQIYYYQIVEITNAGKKSVIAGTRATRVKVKTVDEEREWLKRKATGNRLR